MKRKLQKQIVSVQIAVNKKLAIGYEGLDKYGKGVLREGWEDGYLQALADVTAWLNGYADQNSRHSKLWEPSA